jgi:hypothetical protein
MWLVFISADYFGEGAHIINKRIKIIRLGNLVSEFGVLENSYEHFVSGLSYLAFLSAAPTKYVNRKRSGYALGFRVVLVIMNA